MRRTRVVLAAAHLDHDPSNNRRGNLKSLCQRCHLIHDRPQHLARRRITYLLRRALGDLFLGRYSSISGFIRQALPRQRMVTASDEALGLIAKPAVNGNTQSAVYWETVIRDRPGTIGRG